MLEESGGKDLRAKIFFGMELKSSGRPYEQSDSGDGD